MSCYSGLKFLTLGLILNFLCLLNIHVYRNHLKLGRRKLHRLQKIFMGVRQKPLKMCLAVISDISLKCKILLRDIFFFQLLFPWRTPVRLLLLTVSIYQLPEAAGSGINSLECIFKLVKFTVLTTPIKISNFMHSFILLDWA